MSAIYGPYAIPEIGIEPTLPQPWTHGCEGCVNRLNDVCSKLDQTLQDLVEQSADSPHRPLKSIIRLPNRLWGPNHPQKHAQRFNGGALAIGLEAIRLNQRIMQVVEHGRANSKHVVT